MVVECVERGDCCVCMYVCVCVYARARWVREEVSNKIVPM